MISGANINLDFLYLVNKKDLKGILETGIIKKSKKDSNYNNKIFLMRDTSTSENAEDIKVLVLKNIESNKLCDSPIKIWSVIKRGEENNSEYELYGISIKNYLYKRYSYKKKKEEHKEESNLKKKAIRPVIRKATANELYNKMRAVFDKEMTSKDKQEAILEYERLKQQSIEIEQNQLQQ